MSQKAHKNSQRKGEIKKNAKKKNMQKFLRGNKYNSIQKTNVQIISNYQRQMKNIKISNHKNSK